MKIIDMLCEKEYSITNNTGKDVDHMVMSIVILVVIIILQKSAVLSCSSVE